MKSGWRTGDLGRFAADPVDYPQFEAVSAAPAGVTVWYHQAPKPETIPVETFKRDCTNVWTLKSVVPPTRLIRGMVLTLPTSVDKLLEQHAERDMDALAEEYDGIFSNRNLWAQPRPSLLRAAARPLLPPNRPSTRDLTTLEKLRGRDVRIRHVRLNYCSCELTDSPSLFLLPTALLDEWGSLRVTLWDHLEDDDA